MRAVLLPERGDNRRAITWGNNKWLNQTMPNVINPVYNGLCNPTNSQFNQTSATSSHITTHQHGVQLSLLPYQPSSYSRSIRGASRRVYKVHILLNFAPPLRHTNMGPENYAQFEFQKMQVSALRRALSLPHRRPY